jgi:hypothetical protein
MVGDDLQDQKKVLHQHGELIRFNNNTILSLSTKLEKMKHIYSTQNANQMSLILTQKSRKDF